MAAASDENNVERQKLIAESKQHQDMMTELECLKMLSHTSDIKDIETKKRQQKEKLQQELEEAKQAAENVESMLMEKDEEGFEFRDNHSISQRNALLGRIINMTKNNVFKPKLGEFMVPAAFLRLGNHIRQPISFPCKRVEISKDGHHYFVVVQLDKIKD